MRQISQPSLTLLTAAYLHVPARRLRALIRGEDDALCEWIESQSSRPLVHARHQARECLHRLESLNATIITIADETYPRGLLDLEDPPALLFVRGSLPNGGVAIVGSRTPPVVAQEFARELASRCDAPVISGLATGIDAAAHRGAMEAGNATVAYVGTGLGLTYPPEHRALEEEIVARGGAVVAERLPGETVTKWSLAHRDRLQAAHALATILIASELEGGAMLTMRFAKELRRPRFALTGEGPAYAGNMQALHDGASPLPPDAERAIRLVRRVL